MARGQNRLGGTESHRITKIELGHGSDIPAHFLTCRLTRPDSEEGFENCFLFLASA